MNRRKSQHFSLDGLQHYQRCWLPEGRPAAVVVLVHGLGEHSGRYAPLAEQLTAENYSVYAMDLRGHGLSEGRRIYVDSFQQHLDDVAGFLRHVRTEQPQGPMFLFGHSMGGLIAAWLATRSTLSVCGVAISAVPLQLHSRVFPLLRWLAIPASLLLPHTSIVELNYAKVSRDAQAVAAIERDPLVYHGHIPNRTAGELLRAGSQLQQHLAAIGQPLLILHGTADMVSDPAGARLVYQEAGTTDKTLKLYDGLYHNLLDEPEKDRVMADLIAWLNARRDGCLGRD